MKSAVIVFPGSNCDRDVAVALEQASGQKPHMVWHRETELPDVDLIVLPGGFSFGDYLRCGAMAARAPIMPAVVERAKAGVPTVGICNGFQILTETGLLPGSLMRNADLRFVCRDVHLKVENTDTPFTACYARDQVIRIPVAHGDGNYFTDDATLDRLEREGLVAFRYVSPEGEPTEDANPNGSRRNIAGILNERRTILGLMPHPERLADPNLGGEDGKPFFRSIIERLS